MLRMYLGTRVGHSSSTLAQRLHPPPPTYACPSPPCLQWGFTQDVTVMAVHAYHASSDAPGVDSKQVPTRSVLIPVL